MVSFSETIFPSLPKPKVAREIPFNSSEYWYKYTGEFTSLMVKCPTCGKAYEYMKLRNAAVHEVEAAISDNPNFYRREFMRMCPDFSIHHEILDRMRMYA